VHELPARMGSSLSHFSVGEPALKLTLAYDNRLLLAVFLPQVEGTIAATALVSITNDLQGFDKSSWIITAYMLTYTGLSPEDGYAAL
jgi:hypothetical protein